MQQIDMNPDEFQAKLKKRWQFVEKVNRQFGFEHIGNLRPGIIAYSGEIQRG